MLLENETTKKVLEYIKENYGKEPEFLWSNSRNAAFRHSVSLKWFGVIMVVSKQKLGINSNEIVNILDLKADPILIGALRDKKNYFPAYHMNKEHWITILLNDEIELKEVFELIDLSFAITNL